VTHSPSYAYSEVFEGGSNMSGNGRHYFPGNNTPGGFFSYYSNIINLKEATKVWYIKGGPGTGKSTFMKKIGTILHEEGLDVDFLHCSSDKDSLDGVIFRNEGIAIVDGTSPHIIDPLYPGAVESIINFGQYWNEEGIRRNRGEIVQITEDIKIDFKRAYNYLGAAEKMYDNLQYAYCRAISSNTARRIAEDIVNDVAITKKYSAREGTVRRLFASAFTPQGIANHLVDIIGECKKVYVIKAKTGSAYERILSLVLENVTACGFDAEAFYCSMKPDKKIDHLVIPALSLAVISSNKFHPFQQEINKKEIVTVEFSRSIEEAEDICLLKMEELITEAIRCLAEAKTKRDELENLYIPNMDFEKVGKLRKRIENEIREASCN